MDWNDLNEINQFALIDEESKSKKILILKHSTRCSISSTILNRLERNWEEQNYQKIKPYFLDLLRYRNVSNEIALRYKVEHESPQVLIIHNGNCVYHASHSDINLREIMQFV